MFSDFHFHPSLIKAIDKQGYKAPTDVQQACMLDALAKKDLLVSAQTGSGKTAAFLLPILHLMLKGKKNSGAKALILAPTRELVRQIYKQFTLLSEFTPITAAMLTGGEDFKFQASVLRKNPEVIIATPGRLVDHLKRGSTSLEDLEVFVLDEADRMLDMGFNDDMMTIASDTDAMKATWLFSATLGHVGVTNLGKDLLHEPVSIDLAGARDQHDGIEQKMILADDDDHKLRLLHRLFSDYPESKIVIFTNTKVMAHRLSIKLREVERVGVLQGDMTQDERNHVTQQFRHDTVRILVATDVAARGLDIEGIGLVINYDLARKGDEYVHRIGRTARAGATGDAISFVTAHEWNLMASIERYCRIKVEQIVLPGIEGKYKGPKKIKTNGKAVGKKAPHKKKLAKKAGEKVKSHKKTGGGKRPSRPVEKAEAREGGFTPVKKKRIKPE
ncbi:DEAD/DEAH box helicase [Marinicellulosiphila megalodicopiae]|uniref:DEAD/DEAH box helicase n=1 Tax=Marinicellulosiphila megalodicopiae TaxID=2724896 RepID=UPI003BB08664